MDQKQELFVWNLSLFELELVDVDLDHMDFSLVELELVEIDLDHVDLDLDVELQLHAS